MSRKEQSADVIVVGAGPAGMMAAIRAAQKGCSVLVLEKNSMSGRKLRITGKGRCNLTNACDFEELLANIPGNGKFLYSALRRFSNQDIMHFFEEAGVPLVVERGNRVFPASSQAADVAAALQKKAERLGIRFLFGKEASDLIWRDTQGGKRIQGVLCGEAPFFASQVLLATGGLSYPRTGSNGDGYRLAGKVGHTVVSPKPSLVALCSPETWIKRLEGLSLRNVRLTLSAGKQVLFEEFGELLFTARGISGPLVLSGSRHALERDYRGILASIDLKPALSESKLEERLQRDFAKFDRRQFSNSLGELLPAKLIPVVLSRSGIPSGKQVNQITKEERRQLVRLLKQFTLRIEGSEDFSQAIVTAGGISIKEIQPKTMESKLCRGLFFAGELIDVDGYTGGFNLTIAFSTGFSAGDHFLPFSVAGMGQE